MSVLARAPASTAVPVGGSRDTITTGGGTVVMVIAHSADAGTAGTQVPPSTGARRSTGRR
jgi:hypothetical protein